MKGFDADQNGMLTAEELGAWKNFIQNMFTEYGWDMSQYHDQFRAAWDEAQVNGDNESASRIEVAHFILNSWNIFLE